MEVGQTFVFENIYYDFDECDFRDDSQAELDRLVQMMKDNPGMEVELASHTDQRGEADYNMRLSQCRAESVMNYLVGKGINKSRITPVGYGESRLLKDCSGGEGCDTTGKTDCPCHKKNRRTEVKILKL
jgi:outer membrane protein OmpA-like peptidoglycan-associated protein